MTTKEGNLFVPLKAHVTSSLVTYTYKHFSKSIRLRCFSPSRVADKREAVVMSRKQYESALRRLNVL